jgi:hypothetical protein
MKTPLLVLVLVAGAAQAQGVHRPLTDADALALTHVALKRAEVVFDAGAGKTVQGVLVKRLCIEAMALCAPEQSAVELLVEANGQVKLRSVTSPRPFSAWGLEF